MKLFLPKGSRLPYYFLPREASYHIISRPLVAGYLIISSQGTQVTVSFLTQRLQLAGYLTKFSWEGP